MSQAGPPSLPSSAQVQGVGAVKRATRLPVLVLAAVGLVRRAAPRLFVEGLVVQAVLAVGVAGRLLLARELLQVLERRGLDGAGSGLALLAVALLALTALLQALGVVLQERQRLLEEQVERFMQGQVLDVSQSVDLTAYDDPDFYDQLQRAQYGVAFRPFQMASGLGSVLSGGLAAAAVLVAVGLVLPVLVPVVVLGYVPLWLVTKRGSRAAVAFEVEHTERERKRGYLADVLSLRDFAKEVRASGAAPLVRSWYEELYDERLSWLADLSRTRLRNTLQATAVAGAAAAFALYLLLTGVQAGRLSASAAAVAALAVLELGGRLGAVYGGAARLLEGALFLDDFRDFQARYGLRAAVVREADVETAPPPAEGDTVQVRDVHFSYPGATDEALRGISFSIAPGEFVALVGENGSGKTTLATLLAGLHVPSSGEVLVHGLDVRVWPPGALRRVVAAVFQDYARYELTLGENIGLGDPPRLRDAEAVRAAAVKVGADRLAARLPGGYDALLGRRFFGGHELSVGQWQRIALARAFLRDAPLLVLDEPTASLDPLAEAQVFDAVRELAQDRAVLFVSHRFATVRGASRILVMHQGRIVEQGSHDELMAQNGVYRRLYETQAAPFR